jgi:MFS family permease
MIAQPTGLWRNAAFIKLWTGQTISEFGSRITREAFPFIAVTLLAATPQELGLFGAISSVTMLAFGLFAGMWVDRVSRRKLMIGADLTRLFLLLSVPVAGATGHLTMPLLIAISALMGVIGILFNSAYRAILPSLVSPHELLEGNTKLATTDALAEVGGPAIAGLLIQMLSAPLAIVVDAFSYLFSAVSFLMIRMPDVPEPVKVEEEAPESWWDEITGGLRLIWQDPILWALAFGNALGSFFGMFIGTLYAFYCVRDLHLQAGEIGFLISCGGIGSLLGAWLSPRIGRRYGTGRTLIGAVLITSASSLCIPLAEGAWLWTMICMMAGQIVGDAAGTIYDIHAMTLRQARTPDHLLGRANASFDFLTSAATPLGALVCGVIATLFGARITLFIASIGLIVVAMSMARSALQGMKREG